jgi:zinc protease
VRRAIAGAALALSLVAAAGCAVREVRTGTPMEEGDVIEIRVPDDPTVTFKVWFRVGSQDDPPGKEGLAFLTGQMLAQGSTVERSYEEILEALYPLASGYDVRVDREMTVLTGRTHRDNLDAYWDLFSDAWLEPAFRQDDFDRIKADTLNYLKNTLRFASDEELAKAALQALLFEGTGYAHPPEGTVSGLEAITLDDVRDFYRTWYTRDNVVPALGGGFDEPLAARFVDGIERLPEGDLPRSAPPDSVDLDGSRALLVAKPDADASISFGFPIDVRRGERDFYALWVANSWLGEHRNSVSRLFQVIREQRGLNYGDYSYIEPFPEGGRRQFPPPHVGRARPTFEVWIRTLPDEQAPFALRAALRELDRLVERGMTREQFEATRTFLDKYALHFAETTAARLGYAVDDVFFGIDSPGHLERFRRAMDDLTLEEVNAAIREHLRTEDIGIAIVTGDAAMWRRVLSEGAATPIEYPTPKSDEITREDPEIASWPLDVEHVEVLPVEEAFE